MLDPNFSLIAAKPDNVPIGAMIFLLAIFTWIALRKAYLNDKHIAAGGIPWEKTESDEKLFTWPDLVYTEMMCMILVTVLMIVQAPAFVRILLQRGHFNAADTERVASVLRWYALGMYAWSANYIVARGLYSLQDTLTPAILGSSCLPGLVIAVSSSSAMVSSRSSRAG
jgi:hypothetical protein